MYTKLQIFIQLSPTLTKLCHARLPILHDTLKMTLDHDGHKPRRPQQWRPQTIFSRSYERLTCMMQCYVRMASVCRL